MEPQTNKAEKSNPFRFLQSITSQKVDIFEDDGEKDYIPYLINRGLSLHLHSVMEANYMNIFHDLPKEMQYDFLLHSVRRGKSFSKWPKPHDDEFLKILMDEYSVNERVAAEYARVLDDDQKEAIKKRQEKGG